MSAFTFHADSKKSTPTASARASVSTSNSAVKKSKWQRFVDEFKPVEEPQTPISIYGPLVYKRVPKSQIEKQPADSFNRRASEAYGKFKAAVGGEPVHF